MDKADISKIDTFGMDHALRQAYKADACNEVPIGAVLIDQSGKIIARAYNQVEGKQTQLAHAEMQIIKKATKKLNRWRLSDCTLYVTLQPCLMCMGALIISRINRIVYAANSPLFGCSIDKDVSFGIYKDSLPVIEFQEREEAIKILKRFFVKQRKMKHDRQTSVGKN